MKYYIHIPNKNKFLRHSVLGIIVSLTTDNLDEAYDFQDIESAEHSARNFFVPAKEEPPRVVNEDEARILLVMIT